MTHLIKETLANNKTLILKPQPQTLLIPAPATEDFLHCLDLNRSVLKPDVCVVILKLKTKLTDISRGTKMSKH